MLVFEFSLVAVMESLVQNQKFDSNGTGPNALGKPEIRALIFNIKHNIPDLGFHRS